MTFNRDKFAFYIMCKKTTYTGWPKKVVHFSTYHIFGTIEDTDFTKMLSDFQKIKIPLLNILCKFSWVLLHQKMTTFGGLGGNYFVL